MVRLGTWYPRLAAAAVAAAVVGAGHGGGPSEASKSPDQIEKDAYRAAVHARTVRLQGSYANAGTHGLQVEINLAIRQNTALAGSLSIQGNPISVVVIGSRAYTSASAAFYESQGESASVASQLSGKWLKLSAKDSDGYVSFEHLNQLLDALAHPQGTLSKSGTTTIGGMAAVVVKSSDGPTVAVATHGTPFPLQLVAAGNGSLTFTGWNKPVRIKNPSSYIDVSKQRS